MKWTTANVKNPNYTENHEIYVGTHTGSFKRLNLSNHDNPFHQQNLYDLGKLNKNSRITSLEFGNMDQTEILVGRAECTAQIHSLLSDGAQRSIEFMSQPVVGLARCGDYIVGGFGTGQVQSVSLTDAAVTDDKQLVLTAGDEMSHMRQCSSNRNLVATGGKNRQNNLKVFDVEIGKQVFNSKNLPNDYLQLEVPVWDSDVGFIDEHTLATCSRYGYVRIYDTRKQRRPVLVYATDNQMSFATLVARENYVYTGTTMGALKAFDVRSMKNFVHTYKGFTGSISDVHLDTSGKYLSSASLDRYVRVHHVDSCVMMYQCYVKSKATRVLIRKANETFNNATSDASKEEDENEEELEQQKDANISEDEEYDDIFDNMQTVCENDEEDVAIEDQPKSTQKRKTDTKSIKNKKKKA